MPTVWIDRIENLSMTERLGVVTQLVRKARVTGLHANIDYFVLMDALTSAGIPAANSVLTPGDGFGTLRLVDRHVQLMEDDKSTCDVTLTYEHFLAGANQDLRDPPTDLTSVYGKMRSTVQQKTTNFYYKEIVNPDGSSSKVVIPIVVGHNYPKGKGPPGCKTSIDGGDYDEQGGEISVMFPSRDYHLEGFIYTDEPQKYDFLMLGSINDSPWMGAGKFEWMCTEVAWECMNVGTEALYARPQFKFAFEFQYNSDTWNPTVVYIDPRTGRPPSGLIPSVNLPPFPLNTGGILGVPADSGFFRNPNLLLLNQFPGYEYISYYKEVDFNSILGVFFELTG